MSIVELSDMIRGRKISAVEVAEAQLARISQLDSEFGSYIVVLEDRALDQARRADAEIAAGRYRGLLHGVPIALKDLFDVAGVPTSAGMPMRARDPARSSSTVAARLEAAGAVLLGKLNMTEGAFSEYHLPFRAPRNPWDPSRYAGASSSGSAVAVAAGLCYGSVGTDTGGSIRLPSAANGATGLKPTWGRVSRHGTVELAPTLDTIGPICRSAVDAAAVLQVIAGPDASDSTAARVAVGDLVRQARLTIRGMRLGVDVQWISEGVDDPTRAGVEAAMDVLSGLGAKVVEVRFPESRRIIEDWPDLCGVQAAVAHAATFPSRREEYGPALAEVIESGRRMTGIDYQHLILRRARYRGRVEALFDNVDVLMMPAMAFVAPPTTSMANLDASARAHLRRFTVPFAMSGHPTITMPSGFDSAGLPTAVQLVAPHFQEVTLIRAAGAYQSETDWHRRHPDLPRPLRSQPVG